MELALGRFTPLAQEIQAGKPGLTSGWYEVVTACAESIPLDLLERIAPELATSRHEETSRQAVDPIEGYLSTAEMIVEAQSKPYG
jgi:hypothetical protein